MGKINKEFRPESGQRPVGGIHQGVCGCIIHRSEPFAFEYSPQSPGNIQVWAVWRQEKQEQSPLLPYRSEFGNKFPRWTLALSRTTKVSFLILKERRSRKSATLSVLYA